MVPDATKEEKTRDNHIVIEDGIRCYAGAPMITAKGHVLGNFCVLGKAPRDFTQAEVDRLSLLADIAMSRLEDLSVN